MPNLITCPDCGRQVSPSAASCPQCGRPFRAAYVTPVLPEKKPDIISIAASIGCAGFLGFIGLTIVVAMLSKLFKGH